MNQHESNQRYPIHLETWKKLTHDQALRAVPDFRNVRPNNDKAYQFIRGNKEYLAIRSLRPYGDYPIDPRYALAGAHFLKPEKKARDYISFEIPEEMIALSGMIFGTGRKRTELLREPMQQVGSALRETAESTDGLLPLIDVGDIAFDKTEGRVIFLPPLEPDNGPHSIPDYQEHLDASMTEEFSAFLGENALSDLKEQIQKGFENATRGYQTQQ